MHTFSAGLQYRFRQERRSKRGRVIPYHMVCTVSAEAPISPLPVRGLLAVCHETLRPDLPKPCNQRGFELKVSSSSGRSPHGKDCEERRRRAKDRAGIPQGQRHLGRRLNGEGCMPKEGDFAITSPASRRPKGPSQPLKPVGPWANIRQLAHYRPMYHNYAVYLCKCPFCKGNHVNSPVKPKP